MQEYETIVAGAQSLLQKTLKEITIDKFSFIILKCCAKLERFAGKLNVINMLHRYFYKLTVKYKIFVINFVTS